MNSILDFQKMKKKNEKIVMLTAYDYPSGKLAEESKVDIILVGDSLGMVVLGYENTLEVTVQDIIHHSRATRRGAPNTFIIADMPYSSFHISLKDTKKNAFDLMLKGKANAVKLEGGTASRLKSIKAIVDCEIPVVAHLGLTPQSVNAFGGYKVQGKKDKDYQRILEQALRVQDAGAFMLVLEGIPELLGKEISEALTIPTIGIGAGRFCDGQVMVYHDILSMSDFQPKFVKKYSKTGKLIKESIRSYVRDVKESEFPEIDQVYYPIENE